MASAMARRLIMQIGYQSRSISCPVPHTADLSLPTDSGRPWYCPSLEAYCSSFFDAPSSHHLLSVLLVSLHTSTVPKHQSSTCHQSMVVTCHILVAG